MYAAVTRAIAATQQLVSFCDAINPDWSNQQASVKITTLRTCYPWKSSMEQ
jgi:hypothetical protein